MENLTTTPCEHRFDLLFPPAIDLSYYRKAYPELNHLPDDILLEHCKRFAVEQGHSTCFYDRRENLRPALQKAIDEKNLKALEISPWFGPFLRGENVKYFGTSDYDGLKKQAIEMKLPIENIPREMHFISPTGDLNVINETFDIVFSSHVIEHTPDLIKHLNDVDKLLNSGGLYILAIPDKQYCFDYYKPETTIIDVMDAFFTKRTNALLIDRLFEVLSTNNNPVSHWLGLHGKDKTNTEIPKVTREQLLFRFETYKKFSEAGQYIDVHHWRLIPDTFRKIIIQLNEMKFVNLSLYRLCHTIWGRCEFIAMLEKI